MQSSIILQKFVLKQIKIVKVVSGQSAFSSVKLTWSDSDIKGTVTQAKLRTNLKVVLSFSFSFHYF